VRRVLPVGFLSSQPGTIARGVAPNHEEPVAPPTDLSRLHPLAQKRRTALTATTGGLAGHGGARPLTAGLGGDTGHLAGSACRVQDRRPHAHLGAEAPRRTWLARSTGSAAGFAAERCAGEFVGWDIVGRERTMASAGHRRSAHERKCFVKAARRTRAARVRHDTRAARSGDTTRPVRPTCLKTP